MRLARGDPDGGHGASHRVAFTRQGAGTPWRRRAEGPAAPAWIHESGGLKPGTCARRRIPRGDARLHAQAAQVQTPRVRPSGVGTWRYFALLAFHRVPPRRWPAHGPEVFRGGTHGRPGGDRTPPPTQGRESAGYFPAPGAGPAAPTGWTGQGEPLGGEARWAGSRGELGGRGGEGRDGRGGKGGGSGVCRCLPGNGGLRLWAGARALARDGRHPVSGSRHKAAAAPWVERLAYTRAPRQHGNMGQPGNLGSPAPRRGRWPQPRQCTTPGRACLPRRSPVVARRGRRGG